MFGLTNFKRVWVWKLYVFSSGTCNIAIPRRGLDGKEKWPSKNVFGEVNKKQLVDYIVRMETTKGNKKI